MPTTDISANGLVINKLSKAQYDAIQNPSDTELYLVPDEIDNAPTSGSNNPVKSGGVYSALGNKQDNLVFNTAYNATSNKVATMADISNFVQKSSTSGLIKNDGTIDTNSYLTSHQDISGKADKVTSATNGNFASLDSNGNLTDSGHKHSDYLTSFTETDPVFSASAAHGITSSDITSWNKRNAQSIPFGVVDSTSVATEFTATVDGITELRDGTCVLLKNGVVTSAAGFTIDINNLGAHPVFNNLTEATAETTIFNINYTMLFVYDSTRVVGEYTGAWCCYRGYDSNTNTIGYQLRSNSYSKAMAAKTYRYRILFSSADNSEWVPANTSSSTNATASRAVCQTPINPFGEIVYYGTTAAVAANSRPAAANLWQEYTLALGYSFNNTGAALTLTSWKPVYVKCAPQADGSAIIDSTTPYVQSLPSTDDGKIYIFLGVAYSATNIELLMNHPVFYYKDGAIRQWSNTYIPDISGKESTANKVTSLSSSSTDTQYPSAKCVYDLVGDIETLLAAI